MLPDVISPRARLDLIDAVDWYSSRGVGLGERFRATVERRLADVAQTPTGFALVNQRHRRTNVPKFPYLVYFRVDADGIYVVACCMAGAIQTNYGAD